MPTPARSSNRNLLDERTIRFIHELEASHVIQLNQPGTAIAAMQRYVRQQVQMVEARYERLSIEDAQ